MIWPLPISLVWTLAVSPFSLSVLAIPAFCSSLGSVSKSNLRAFALAIPYALLLLLQGYPHTSQAPIHFCVTRYICLFNVRLNSPLCEADMAYVLHTSSHLASSLACHRKPSITTHLWTYLHITFGGFTVCLLNTQLWFIKNISLLKPAIHITWSPSCLVVF